MRNHDLSCARHHQTRFKGPILRTTLGPEHNPLCKRPRKTTRIAAFASILFARTDRKSTRLNSSHLGISYAVFCLKKKNNHLTYEYRETDYTLSIRLHSAPLNPYLA